MRNLSRGSNRRAWQQIAMRRLRATAPRLLRASSSTTTAASPQLAAARSAVRAEVKQRTEHLTETVLAPLNARLNGPLERSPFSEGIPLPFVLLLGNHELLNMQGRTHYVEKGELYDFGGASRWKQHFNPRDGPIGVQVVAQDTSSCRSAFCAR